MRDKLAEVIEGKIGSAFAGDTGRLVSEEIADAALAWFREYLGSDEVMDRAATAFAGDLHNPLRAALSSILPEPYETSGWSEIVEQSDGR